MCIYGSPTYVFSGGTTDILIGLFANVELQRKLATVLRASVVKQTKSVGDKPGEKLGL